MYFGIYDRCGLDRNIAEVCRADTRVSLRLGYADCGVAAGFPSPAQDYISLSIDLNRELVKHPASTFYARVVGDSMCEEGIEDGDMIVIDKSIEPEHGDLAVCCVDGEFTLKRLNFSFSGEVMLMPSNHRYRPIRICEGMNFRVWGIVTHTIKSNRRRKSGTERW